MRREVTQCELGSVVVKYAAAAGQKKQHKYQCDRYGFRPQHETCRKPDISVREDARHTESDRRRDGRERDGWLRQSTEKSVEVICQPSGHRSRGADICNQESPTGDDAWPASELFMNEAIQRSWGRRRPCKHVDVQRDEKNAKRRQQKYQPRS